MSKTSVGRKGPEGMIALLMPFYRCANDMSDGLCELQTTARIVAVNILVEQGIERDTAIDGVDLEIDCLLNSRSRRGSTRLGQMLRDRRDWLDGMSFFLDPEQVYMAMI